MNDEIKLERTEIASSSLDFLLARLKSEIDELDQRVETLFENINKLKGC